MHLVLYETGEFASLAPFTFVRPTFLLRCGISTLLEKQIRAYTPTRISLWVRPELESVCRTQAIPLIRALTDAPVEINQPLDNQPAVLCDGRILAMKTVSPNPVSLPKLTPADAMATTDKFRSAVANAAAFPSAIRPWDLLAANGDALLQDIAWLRGSWRTLAGIDGSVRVVGQEDVLLGGEVTLKPGCVLDASGGPIALGAGAIIGHNAVIQGPCFIGENSEIAPLSLIRPRTTIGPRCKLGGEVSASIVHGYSNKAHDGFLGDSYLGEWVNFGAGTTTSNLKTTYGEVTMHTPGGGEMKTGRMFLGSLVGDHSKTAIGTRLMTGSYVGCSSMIATSAYPPRAVKSFRFLTTDRDEDYEMEKAIAVATAAFARRQKRFTAEDAAVLRAAAKWSRELE